MSAVPVTTAPAVMRGVTQVNRHSPGQQPYNTIEECTILWHSKPLRAKRYLQSKPKILQNIRANFEELTSIT
eukprot:5595711-Amphidinium_carterae.1